MGRLVRQTKAFVNDITQLFAVQVRSTDIWEATSKSYWK